jgi:phage protein D
MYTATKLSNSGRNAVHAARAIVVVNGQQVRFDSVSVEQNGFTAADSFQIEMPFFVRDSSSGDALQSAGPDFATALMTSDTVPVQVYVGYPSAIDPNNVSKADLTQVMDGYMDTAEFNFSEGGGETVTLNGRNKVGALIDTKVVDKFPNKTASAIASAFAAEHGLTAIATDTTELAGSYYKQQGAALGAETTQWDLLLYLAKRENFIVRVRGNELLFGPYGTVVADSTPIQYTYGYDIETLYIERSPHAARDVVVTVLTYDRNGKKRIKEVASSTTQAAQRLQQQVGRRAKYDLVYNIPGLTRQQAQNRAQQLLGEFSRKQIIGRITAAGNPALSVDRQIALNGAGQGLDGTYYLNRIVQRFGVSMGYTMESSFSSQTDFTLADTADPFSGIVNPAGTVSGVALANGAAAIAGKQFHANDCARGVNQVLQAAGINLGLSNPNYAPNYEGLGTTITDAAKLQPGDLVLTEWGWDSTLNRYDAGHIGIYAGNGQMWNVSTSNGYRWSLTGLGSFHQGQRITK